MDKEKVRVGELAPEGGNPGEARGRKPTLSARSAEAEAEAEARAEDAKRRWPLADRLRPLADCPLADRPPKSDG
jgi:hypothetical protein